MNVKKDWDPTSDEVNPTKGTNYQDNPGLAPSNSAIPETPGEKATNDAVALSYNKGQNFGKGGSGYTKSG